MENDTNDIERNYDAHPELEPEVDDIGEFADDVECDDIPYDGDGEDSPTAQGFYDESEADAIDFGL
jgi:hypothetical protein